MALPEGSYKIYSVVDGEKRLVYRAPYEDKTLRPKPIWALIGRPYASPWVFEKDGEDYVLRAFGAPIGMYPDFMTGTRRPMASMIEDPLTWMEWVIQPVSNGHRSLFKICTRNRDLFWTVAPDEQHFGRMIELQPQRQDFQQVFEIELVQEYVSSQKHGGKSPSRDDENSQARFGYGTREKKFCA